MLLLPWATEAKCFIPVPIRIQTQEMGENIELKVTTIYNGEYLEGYLFFFCENNVAL